jgi:trimeric autotransporter adhesin
LTTRFYNYNADTNLYNAVASPSTTTFAIAQGYLIRTPNNHPIIPTTWTGTFTGVPNNGSQSVTMTNLGVGKRFNMIGNPYPSTLDMASFVAANTNNITGSLYFWRKTNSTLTTVPYCTWTAGTFVSNGEAQVFDPLGIINVGQGFFVEAKNIATSVNFTNAMRIANNNNQFFRNSNNIDFNRIWLNATDTTGLFSQTAIGYNTNGTIGLDEHDGRFINDGGITIASLIGAEVYATQSRNYPFDNNDVVPISFKTTTAGN